MRIKPLGAAALGVVLGGCATLDRGSSDRIFLVSEPPGAMATLSTGQGCTTPCSVVLDRRDVFSVTFAKAAFRSTTVDVVTRISASGAGDFGENIITAGAGAVVDAATGAVLEHSPNPVRVTLAPLEKPPARRPSGKVAS